MMTLYRTLYKIDSKGNTRVWEIHHNRFQEFWTRTGRFEGKMIENRPTKVTPKVKRTQKEQCELEMNSKVSKKQDEKYVDDLTKMLKADKNLQGFSPMLAKSWEKEKHKLDFPLMVQPKLDGVRCLATKEGFFTRNRKRIEACDHIREQLKPFFDQFPTAMLDGELYSHSYRDNFEKIVSIVRKTKEKMTDEDLRLQQKINYHIYDLNTKDPFRRRVELIYEFFAGMDSVIPVETLNVNNDREVNEAHISFANEGYEGVMVRNPESPYEGKRTHNLLKLKDFIDEEFEIVDVCEGKGNLAGHAASFVLRANNAADDLFNAKLKGSLDRLRYLFENFEEVNGKMATVTYQNLTQDGIPRFPVIKSIRGLKDKSDWV